MKTNVLPSDKSSSKTREYLDRVNHAPYFTIIASAMGIFCLFTLILVAGVF